MSKTPLRNFILKNILFGATNIVKNSEIEKYVYSGYGLMEKISGVLTMTMLQIL